MCKEVWWVESDEFPIPQKEAVEQRMKLANFYELLALVFVAGICAGLIF